jgi:hypothetical protein
MRFVIWHEIYHLDEDGAFDENDKVERLKVLAPQCPARLKKLPLWLGQRSKYRDEVEERPKVIVEKRYEQY